MSKHSNGKKCFGENTVYSDGRVFSRLGRELKQFVSNAGYARVELHWDGASKKFSVHRLVADAFVQNPHNKPHVNHIDGNKLNNSFDNLEWVTRSENQLHAYRNGLQKGYKKPTKLSPKHRAALCGSRWRGQKRIYHAGGLEFDTPDDAAAHFGFNRQTFYNRSKSERYPEWWIEVRREVK